MASTFSTPTKNIDDTSSSTTVLSVILFFAPVWFLMAIQLVRVQEIWFDPWDVLPQPTAGTTAAIWNPFIKGPLFLTFAVFVLVGSVLLLGLKMRRSAEKFSMVRKLLKLQWIGFLAFTVFIFVSRLPFVHFWSEPLNNLSAFEYINYNHYIRTVPFIALSFLLFTILYWRMWRVEIK